MFLNRLISRAFGPAHHLETLTTKDFEVYDCGFDLVNNSASSNLQKN